MYKRFLQKNTEGGNGAVLHCSTGRLWARSQLRVWPSVSLGNKKKIKEPTVWEDPRLDRKRLWDQEHNADFSNVEENYLQKTRLHRRFCRGASSRIVAFGLLKSALSKSHIRRDKASTSLCNYIWDLYFICGKGILWKYCLWKLFPSNYVFIMQINDMLPFRYNNIYLFIYLLIYLF